MKKLTKHDIFDHPQLSGPFRKNYFERYAWERSQHILGVDEVGRGCLAGPIVVAAVILPISRCYRGLKDSKLLTANQRETAFRWIKQHCYWAVTFADHRRIQSRNIYQATRACMKRAIIQLHTMSSIIPAGIVVDAMPLSFATPSLSAAWIRSFPRAESISCSVAAASIVAKVTRDQLMGKIDTLFPQYQFAQHKGYGTSEHQQAVLTHGSTIIHRKAFINTMLARHTASHEQQTIC